MPTTSKTVVIGASSGLGRCIAVGLAQKGAQVALLARRLDRLERAAKEAGPEAVAIECDICDETSVRSAIDSAAESLGGIDNLVYTPAIGPLVRLVDTDADTWRQVFSTNVIGAALATAAAVPHLTASKGKVTSFLSYNLGSWAFNLQDRWLSGFPRATTNGLVYVQPRVNSVNYQDITIDKKFTVDNQTLDAYLSVQNVGNVLPPVALVDNPNVPGVFFQGIDNTNVSTYDPLGRYFTIGVRASL